MSSEQAVKLVSDWIQLPLTIETVKQLDENLGIRWYQAQENGVVWSEVYEDPSSLHNTLFCWHKLSQHYTKGAIEAIRELGRKIEIKSIVDYGGGCGFASLAMSTEFPEMMVSYVDLELSPSYSFAKWLFRIHGDGVIAMNDSIRLQTPIHQDVFMSFENFEHFESPLEELDRILELFTPKVLIYSDAYEFDSAGHFDEYYILGIPQQRDKMSMKFKLALNSRGFRQQSQFEFWNNKPHVFVKE